MSRLAGLRNVIDALLCALATGCSVSLEPQREQCVTDSDCAQYASELGASTCVNSWCEPEPKWRCLAEPPEPSADLGRFTVTLHTQDILTRRPMPGVNARLCPKLDVDCSGDNRSEAVTDERGDVRFQVEVDSDRGFSGYVQFTRDDLMPGLYFFNPPIRSSVEVPQVQLLTTAIATQLTKQVGTTFDPARGLILLAAYDCTGEPAAGVTLETDEADPRAASFYSVNGLPAATATETDSSGYGGVINAPPGTIAVKGRLASDERVVGTVSVLVKPGSITYSRLVPGGN